ncbi:hypothetical protein [Lysinibacillus sp. BNK-21]|uniref:hypothetical protein n=1 Tax=Lysinibacillus sp. BNK-21 TaxID=3376156 RepID=UPI003B427BC7
MYYPELMSINLNLSHEFLEKFDSWIGNRDFTKKRGLKASQLIRDLKIDEQTAQVLLIEATKLGILKKVFLWNCPFCLEFKRYNSLTDIPTYLECNETGNEFELKSYLNQISIIFDIDEGRK